jgi:hypothetical protein
MAAVLKNYNLSMVKNRLVAIYQKVMATDISHHINKPMLLSQFFKPETMRMLNWSEYIE